MNQSASIPPDHSPQEIHKRVWWSIPAMACAGAAAVVMAYLHMRFGTMNASTAIATVAISVIILVISYSLVRKYAPRHDHGLATSLFSIIVALPVFIVAYIGLGYEIPSMLDFGTMYVLGVWIASSESAEGEG